MKSFQNSSPSYLLPEIICKFDKKKKTPREKGLFKPIFFLY